MPSSFKWVDFAEDDRQKMMEILHLFSVKEIREELGIGTVRDAFSDILFPGTSTLHTRAKYMLFVPWLFMKHERKQTHSKDIEEYSRETEIKLIKELLKGGEEDGVIGRVALDNLKILPSYMYWSGLGRWGIRRFNGSLYQYFRSLDGFYFYRKNVVKSDDNELVSSTAYNWDPNIVSPPKYFPEGADFALSRQEAEYLHDRILASCSGSLLACLVDKTKITNVNFVWQHPQFALFSKEHQKIIWHARNFSESIHGAILVYNLMLSEKAKDQELIEKYREKIKRWADELKKRFHEIKTWDLNEFWEIVFSENSHIPIQTRRFIEHWIYLVKENKNLIRLSENEQARSLIYRREVRIKGKKSRLKNKRMLEHWSGESGVYYLGFRWTVSKRIVNDILQGLGRS